MNLRSTLLISTLLLSSSLPGSSQDDTIRLGRSFGLQISGFARADYIYDSRQTAEAVEGLFTFYPANRLPDADGKDINAAPKANFISIASRLSTRFFAPEILGARSTAYLEMDFTGTSNTNGIRLRQAWASLAWKRSELLFGRTWHPFSSGAVPNVVALNTGAPFWAFNRSDQVRFDYKPGRWLLSAAAIYQSDYASLGPVPGTASGSIKSSTYLRDAVLPEFTAHATYRTPEFQIGVIGSVKSIKPRLYTMPDYADPAGKKYKTGEKLTTYAAQAYAQYLTGKWILKAQATYAQNTTESLMIGGYAVSTVDPATGHERYTPTQYMNYWIDIDYGTKWQAGLFAGYLNSLGTLDNVEGPWHARAHDIKYMYRISPHLFYNVNNWQFAAEVEYTAAAFGRVLDDQKAKIVDASEVGNLRANLMVCFYF